MTIPEIIAQSKNQVLLLSKTIDELCNDMKGYPNEDYKLVSLAKLEYGFNALLTLNDTLTTREYDSADQ